MFQYKLHIIFSFCIILLIVKPDNLLYFWIIFSPILSNFLSKPFFYSVFGTRLVLPTSIGMTEGFAINELFQFDRIVLLLVFSRIIFSKKYTKLKADRTDSYFIVLIFIFLISSLFSENALNSIRIILDTFCMYYISYYIGKNLINNNEKFSYFINSLIILSLLLTVIGVIEPPFMLNKITWANIDSYRITGPFQYWESMGTILGILFFISAYKISLKQNIFRKTFLLILIFLELICIYLTQTRTSMIAIILGTIVGGYKGRKVLPTKIVFGSTAVLTIIFIIIFYFPNIITQTNFYKHTVNRETESRVEQYSAANKMFLDNIFFGIGFKNFVYEFENYIDPNQIVHSRAGKTYLHNSYLLIGVENGIFALVTMILLVLSIYKMIMRFNSLQLNRNEKLWGITVLSIFTSYFVSGLAFDLFFLVSLEGKIFYMTMGITSGMVQRKSES